MIVRAPSQSVARLMTRMIGIMDNNTTDINLHNVFQGAVPGGVSENPL